MPRISIGYMLAEIFI